MLTTTILAMKAPIVICPAMNENMWLNRIVQENVRKLKAFGYPIVDPEYREMACGGEGWGRLARLEVILSKVIEVARELDERPHADEKETLSSGRKLDSGMGIG